MLDNLRQPQLFVYIQKAFENMRTGLIIVSPSSQLQHQGTITVNEEGTEAAALTQVGFMPLSTQNRFVADHPFLFVIYEHRTDCLVFVGRVVDPSQS